LARHRFLSSSREAASPPAGFLLAASGLVILASLLLLGGTYLLGTVGRLLVVQDSATNSDAIVVLSGDWGARLEQGVELFKGGYAPVLILAGGGEEGRPAAAEVMKRQAVEMGVPAASVLLVDGSASTWEDAVFTRELMARAGLGSAIVVTSPYHQLRASLTFARVFEGSGIALSNYPARNDAWQPDSWWRSRSSVHLTMMELAKLAYYKLSGYL
jgi:uncharacterized SAM-binding protein YcdF (DUF218 family)